ncbi:MAG: hypothetical protein IJ740_19140 [Ruminococcus sp.]|nr:hypothetical protein [Ruminococcus sp.]MBR1752958.1 hypothetical protein [Ruminococcus sp.]
MDNVPHCKMIEDMLDEVRQEVKIRCALRMIRNIKLSDEEISKVTELTLEEVKELKAQASAVTT